MTMTEYLSAGNGMTEIQYWDTLDNRYHSYLVEGDFLMDEIVGETDRILEEMPPGAKVFITMGDVAKLLELQDAFEDYLIANVVFITPTDIMKGHLRGQQGALLICGSWLMNESVLDFVYREQQLMKCNLPMEEEEWSTRRVPLRRASVH